VLDQGSDHGFVTGIAKDKFECRLPAEVEQRMLPVKQGIQDGYLIAFVQEMLAEDRAQITRAAGDQYFRAHAENPVFRKKSPGECSKSAGSNKVGRLRCGPEGCVKLLAAG